MKKTVVSSGVMAICIGLFSSLSGCATNDLPQRITPVKVGIGQYVKGTEKIRVYENEYFYCDADNVYDYPCNNKTKKTEASQVKPKFDIKKLLKNEPFATVNFDFNKSILREDALVILNEMDFSKLQGKRILVRGYTDNVGGKEYNQELAKERAVSVENFLRKKDLSNEFIPLAYGLCCYVESNDTDSGREKNRRVEIYVDN